MGIFLPTPAAALPVQTGAPPDDVACEPLTAEAYLDAFAADPAGGAVHVPVVFAEEERSEPVVTSLPLGDGRVDLSGIAAALKDSLAEMATLKAREENPPDRWIPEWIICVPEAPQRRAAWFGSFTAWNGNRFGKFRAEASDHEILLEEVGDAIGISAGVRDRHITALQTTRIETTPTGATLGESEYFVKFAGSGALELLRLRATMPTAMVLEIGARILMSAQYRPTDIGDILIGGASEGAETLWLNPSLNDGHIILPDGTSLDEFEHIQLHVLKPGSQDKLVSVGSGWVAAHRAHDVHHLDRDFISVNLHPPAGPAGPHPLCQGLLEFLWQPVHAYQTLKAGLQALGLTVHDIETNRLVLHNAYYNTLYWPLSPPRAVRHQGTLSLLVPIAATPDDERPEDYLFNVANQVAGGIPKPLVDGPFDKILIASDKPDKSITRRYSIGKDGVMEDEPIPVRR